MHLLFFANLEALPQTFEKENFNFGFFMVNRSPNLSFLLLFFKKRSGAWGQTVSKQIRYDIISGRRR